MLRKAGKISGILVLVLSVAFGFAVMAKSGSLNPAAGPGPTMKTLDEVEARTALTAANTPGDSECIFRISSSGSYYLPGNVTGAANKSGIIVAADDVTIDLNGYSLKGVTDSLDGIRPGDSYRKNLVVYNGIIRDWGGNGIATYVYAFPNSYSISNCRIEKIIANDNGGNGISAAYNSVVRQCISRDNGQTGITMSNNSGVIESCTAVSNDGDGISCAEGVTMSNCMVTDNTGVGINCVNSGHVIKGCTVLNNDGGGISAGSSSVIKDCEFQSNKVYGIKISFNCLLSDNNVVGNQGDGISGVNISGQGRTRIEGNNISGNTGKGINLTNNTGNFIYKNTLRSNGGGDMNVGASNSAPVSSNPATAGAWYNIVLTP